MKKSNTFKSLAFLIIVIFSSSCSKELDEIQIDEDIFTSETFYQNCMLV